MSIPRISPEDVKARLDTGDVFLDVRSTPEFRAGRVPGAVHIPLLEMTAAGMTPNPDFVAQVEARFPKDTRLIVGCRRGGRSLRAAEQLAAAGYTDVTDMRGGFEAELDGAGQVSFPGWTMRGLPVER